MQRRPQQTLAALLITASLAMPAAAHAASFTGTTAGVPADAAPTAPMDPAKLTVSRERAITIARNMFAIPQAYGEPNVSAEQSADGVTWSIQFESTDSRKGLGTITVDVDAATGSILRYSRWAETAGGGQASLRFTRTEAAGRAQYWLDMLAPALRPWLRAVERTEAGDYYGPGEQSYTFMWERMAEGYPSRDGSVYILIDAGTGDLREFSRSRWQQGTFKLPPTLLTKAKAEAIFRAQLPMQLMYQYFETPGTTTGEWRLVYRPLLGEYPLLSQEGKVVDFSGMPIDLGAGNQMQLVPGPDKPYKAPNKPLTREEALALARSVTGQTAEPTSANYRESGGEQKFRSWSFSWQSEGKETPGEHLNVEVDVDRGVIRSYDSWRPLVPESGKEPGITPATAREAALQFMRETRPDLGGKLMIMPVTDRQDRYFEGDPGRPDYFVRFAMLKNGVIIGGREITVVVDGTGGKVRNSWGNEFTPDDSFPAAQAGITPAEAMDAYLKHPGLELAWQEFWAPSPGDAAPRQLAPQLVWAPANSYMPATIDARTGALVDDRGRDMLDAAKRPADIAGQPAEREIELLWTRGILEVKDGKFNPNQAATAGDIARWLVMARGMSPYGGYDFRRFGGERMASAVAASPSGPYLGAALQAGIILPEEFGPEAKPEASVSREMLALWTARAMGYGMIAQMPNRIDMPFADRAAIGAKYANAVALLHGLGMVTGDAATSFEPQRAATRGEAAKFIFAITSAAFQR